MPLLAAGVHNPGDGPGKNYLLGFVSHRETNPIRQRAWPLTQDGREG